MLGFKQTEAILYKYKYMDAELNMLDLEIERVNQMSGDVKAMVYDDMPKGSAVGSCVENDVLNKERLLLDLEYQRDKILIQKNMIEDTLEGLPDELKKLFNVIYGSAGDVRRNDVCNRLCIGKDKYYTDKNKLVKIFGKVLW